jgi:hypothetical protein
LRARARARKQLFSRHAEQLVLTEEGGLLKAKAMNEVDAGHDRATPEEERVIQSKGTCDAKKKNSRDEDMT